MQRVLYLYILIKFPLLSGTINIYFLFQQSDSTDINKKLRQLLIKTPMVMTMEEKIAIINKHFAIDVGNVRKCFLCIPFCVVF
jgi:hypothetical protein